jgi:thiamine pyrophosphokinase
MARFAILLGGNLTITARLRRQLAGARVIAADSGMIHAAVLGLVPELWVGDFDSAGSELTVQYKSIPRQTHPAEKDTTDGALAIAEALRRGATEVVMVGGFGGQSDHMLGHFGQLLQLAERNCIAIMSSGYEEALAFRAGKTPIDCPPGSRLSLIPFGDLVGLDLEGVKWPLAGRNVPLGSTLTISNVALGPVRLSLKSGYGVAVFYPQLSDG